MSGRNMALDVLVRLKDLLSGPLKRAQGVVKGFTDAIKKIGLVGSTIAAISFTAPIAQAAEFQQKLLDIAGTAGLSGQSAFNFVAEQKKMFEALALATGIYSDTIADGAGLMTAAGLNQSDITGSLAGIARATRAANADFKDMSGVATASIQNLKLPASQVEDALAGLITAGKLGSFEMKNMARYFPTLTSQAASLGITGREAINSLGAALQIAMKGTADPSEAANNLKNFLSKLKQPVTQKAFAEAGVDLNAVMMNAAAKGINPMEAVVKKIMDLTGISNKEIAGFMEKAKANGLSGAEALAQLQEQLTKIHGAGKLGELFQDQQVMDFLTPMLANIEEYKKIKEAVAGASAPDIMKDFQTQLQGLEAQFTKFKELGIQAIREVGEAFGEWLPKINSGLETLLEKMRQFNEDSGGMAHSMLFWGGGAILLAGALGTIGLIISGISAGISAIVAIGATVAGAISLPFLAIGAALAVAAGLVWYYWDDIKKYTSEAWSWLTSTVSENVDLLKGKISGMWDGAKTKFDELKNWMSNLGTEITNAIGKIDLAAIGIDAMNSLWNGLKSQLQSVLGWASSIGDQIKNALGFGGGNSDPANRGRDGQPLKEPNAGGGTAPVAPARGRNGLPLTSPAVSPTFNIGGGEKQEIVIQQAFNIKGVPGLSITSGGNKVSDPKVSINTGKSVGTP